MKMNFYNYMMMNYLQYPDGDFNKGTPLHDFANDMTRDADFPKNPKSFDDISDHLKLKGACADAVRTGRSAWKKFEKFKEGQRKNYGRRWRESHREDIKAYRKRYYDDHRESIRAYYKEYRQNHLEELRKKERQARKRKPEKMKEYTRNKKYKNWYIRAYDGKYLTEWILGVGEYLKALQKVKGESIEEICRKFKKYENEIGFIMHDIPLDDVRFFLWVYKKNLGYGMEKIVPLMEDCLPILEQMEKFSEKLKKEDAKKKGHSKRLKKAQNDQKGINLYGNNKNAI